MADEPSSCLSPIPHISPAAPGSASETPPLRTSAPADQPPADAASGPGSNLDDFREKEKDRDGEREGGDRGGDGGVSVGFKSQDAASASQPSKHDSPLLSKHESSNCVAVLQCLTRLSSSTHVAQGLATSQVRVLGCGI